MPAVVPRRRPKRKGQRTKKGPVEAKFELQDVGEMVATAPIKRGDCVLREKPQLCFVTETIRDFELEEKDYLVQNEVQKMSEENQALFHALSPCYAAGIADDNRMDPYPFLDRLLTHGFDGTTDGLEDGYPCICLSFTAARINHSCRPNVFSHYNDRQMLTFHAIRDIEVGDQLSVKYGPVNVYLPTSDRQAACEKISFNCRCER
ncbi:hypothetical protein KIPB_003458 [Kipferlia bialata]|uniref:SET domain-containing protein n=1 Tax=Kipferlia bialata TaxID=797122 RepID=A0A9K3CTH3_9EUKA|nr:hypothetical protein KIPB_003458 [Kipferlia bialata]|eukprot:g3458.t1